MNSIMETRRTTRSRSKSFKSDVTGDENTEKSMEYDVDSTEPSEQFSMEYESYTCNLSSESDTDDDNGTTDSKTCNTNVLNNKSSFGIENTNESGFHEPSSVSEYFDFGPLLQNSENESENTETKPDITKNKIKHPKTKNKDVNNIEITEALALGEKAEVKNIKNELPDTSENYEVPKQVEIMVNVPNAKNKKPTDIEQALKRRLNLIKQEWQLRMHQVSLLVWVAHGNYINSVLSDPELLSTALSLLPSDKCYPKNRMDMFYLEELIKWYNKKIVLSKNTDSVVVKAVNVDYLKQQIREETTTNRRDFTFIFICILRALGVHTRLTINLTPLPIKLTKNDLLPVTNKMDTEKSSKNSQNDSNRRAEKTKDNKSESAKRRRSSNASYSRKNVSSVQKNDEVKTEESDDSSKYFVKESKHFVNHENRKNTSKKRSNSKCAESSSKSKQGSKCFDENKNTRKTENTESSDDSVYFKNPKESESKRVLRDRSKIIRNEKSESKITGLEDGVRSSKSKCGDKVATRALVSESVRKMVLEQQESSKNAGKSNQSLENSKGIDVNEKLKGQQKSRSSSKKKGPIKNTSSSDAGSSTDDSESQFATPKKKPVDPTVDNKDSNANSKKSNEKEKNDYWIEAFLEGEELWVCIDISKKRYHCAEMLYNNATQPVRYVLSWNMDKSIKDVTRRYDPQWLTHTRKLRVNETWWAETLAPYKSPNTARNREEDEELDKRDIDQPLPSSISDYKNHPLYVLERHLLKFQAIYPKDTKPVGYVKGEPVYPRSCVHNLHGREMWIKEAKVVKLGEEPYKIVKGRQKKDKYGLDTMERKDLELFGKWQLEDYVPPEAKGGIVPRNAFGNVELFKACMLPKGTAHLQVPGLMKVANKLKIDCAPAITGFEFNHGLSYPVKDGFVVCEEYVDILLDAWNAEIDEAARRESEKRRERAVQNWKKLVRLIRIQKKLKRKYNFKDLEPACDETKPKRKMVKKQCKT